MGEERRRRGRGVGEVRFCGDAEGVVTATFSNVDEY